MTAEAQAGAYPDLWRKGRYRAELSALLPFGPDAMDVALGELDYHIVDAGQAGRSYRHSQNANLTADLDELAGLEPYVRLVLRKGDLDESAVDPAVAYLNALYERICEICGPNWDGYDYEPMDDDGVLDCESPVFLGWTDYKSNLTYMCI